MNISSVDVACLKKRNPDQYSQSSNKISRMDKEEIINKLKDTDAKTALLSLLNDVKIEYYGDKTHPFEMRQIAFYSNPKLDIKRYNDFEIPKKTGETRKISAPVNGLKAILRCLNIILQEIYEPSKYAMGFVRNRSVVDNAKKHVCQNYVFNIDLKDFFPSITRSRIYYRLKAKPFELSDDMARIISGLCCMKVTENDEVKYILPQGAPTSPTITNIICERLDRRLAGLAKRFGLNYTRYADDITFSSSHNVYQEESEFRKELQRIITKDRFVINDKKIRLQKRGGRQEVTGVIVCEKTNVSKRYTREIRSLLYIWERYGYEDAVSCFYPRYKSEKGHVKKGNPNLYAVLEGKLLYLKMVKGEKDSVYKRLQDKYDRLMETIIPITKETNNRTNNEALISELENLLDELLK